MANNILRPNDHILFQGDSITDAVVIVVHIPISAPGTLPWCAACSAR